MDDYSAKIGQLLLVGFHGTTPDDPSVVRAIEYAEKGMIGGVILFRYNIESRAQVERLVGALRDAKSYLPLFIALDQEGGRVQRISSKNGFADTPSAAKISSNSSPAEALEIYRSLGAMLSETGFNLNFAPCIDLDGAPQSPAIGALERSYSSDPDVVARYAGAMIEGLRENGVISCLKHFPGHGRALGDSHLGLIDISNTWGDVELEPYRILVERNEADMVMTSHLFHKTFGNAPVTLSREWLSRLREDIGFSGPIVADDLHMGAMIRHYDMQTVILEGLRAGLDILMFSNNPLAAAAQGVRHDADSNVDSSSLAEWRVPDEALPEKVIRIIKGALEAGSLDPQIIDAAYGRVTALKERLLRKDRD